MTTTATAPAPPHRLLAIALVLVAAIELLDALSSVSNIFRDYGHTTQLLIFAQAVTSVQLALAPLVSGAAFVLVLMGKLRHAIVAMAVRMLLVWLADLPSIALRGLEVSATFEGLGMFAFRFIYPLMAVAAIVLAHKNQRLALAVVFVSLPTVIALIGFAVFAISIAIYGF